MASDRDLLFRRILIVLVGLTMALVAGAILLWWLPKPSSVTSYLQVKSKPSNIRFLFPEQQFSPKEFELFQQTQLTLLKSELVLMAALSRRAIAELNAVASKRPDELLWLNDELQVSFPGEGEVLMISYEGDEDPEEMKKIIDAIVDAYMNEVVTAERSQGIEETRGLEAKLNQLIAELRSKREKYFMLQQQLASPASENEGSQGNASESGSVPMMPKPIPNGELMILQEEIDELAELRHELSLYLQKMRIRDDMSGESTKVMQKAFSTENINSDLRYFYVALGGVGTFIVTCVVLALIGQCIPKRDTAS